MEVSHRFLHGYITSLLCIQQHPQAEIVNEKMVLEGQECHVAAASDLKRAKDTTQSFRLSTGNLHKKASSS